MDGFACDMEKLILHSRYVRRPDEGSILVCMMLLQRERERDRFGTGGGGGDCCVSHTRSPFSLPLRSELLERDGAIVGWSWLRIQHTKFAVDGDRSVQ